MMRVGRSSDSLEVGGGLRAESLGTSLAFSKPRWTIDRG